MPYRAWGQHIGRRIDRHRVYVPVTVGGRGLKGVLIVLRHRRDGRNLSCRSNVYSGEE